MPSINEYLFGSSPETKKLATGSPIQQRFGQHVLRKAQRMEHRGLGESNHFLRDLLNPESQAYQQFTPGSYEDFSSPYLQQFEEQILPRLAEKYAGMGALSSSGFGQAIGGAGAGLQSQLAQLYSGLQQQYAGLRGQMQMGAAGGLSSLYQNLASLGLGYSPFAYQQNPGSEGLVAGMGKGFAQGFGQGAGAMI